MSRGSVLKRLTAHIHKNHGFHMVFQINSSVVVVVRKAHKDAVVPR